MTDPAPRIRRARALRQTQTLPEERLWDALRGRGLGVKFRRQYTIDRYVADFACVERKLVVELDGPIHDERLGEDAERTQILEARGWLVIRISNRRVMEDFHTVLEELCVALR